MKIDKKIIKVDNFEYQSYINHFLVELKIIRNFDIFIVSLFLINFFFRNSYFKVLNFIF